MNPESQEVMHRTRPMYWSVQREFWENRSLYLAPLVIDAFVVFGFLFSLIALPRKIRSLSALDPIQQSLTVARPFSFIAMVLILGMFVIAAFYCLDALHIERRDRSLLFWKSLPVSDRTTVFAKASIPIVVLPLFVIALIIVTQWVMLMFSTVTLLMNGVNPAAFWRELPIFQMTLVLIYGVIAHSLWYAPIYAWLLLISAWAKRVPILWAVLPLFIGWMTESLVLGTSHFVDLVRYRAFGAMTEAFNTSVPGKSAVLRLAQLDPIRFLTSPGLWSGLILAAVFLALAIRLRRDREPM